MEIELKHTKTKPHPTPKCPVLPAKIKYKSEHKTIYVLKHTYNAIFIAFTACKNTLKIAGASNYFVRK